MKDFSRVVQKTVLQGLILGTMLFASGALAATWAPPAGTPSAANNAPEPINTSATAQTKTGSLTVNSTTDAVKGVSTGANTYGGVFDGTWRGVFGHSVNSIGVYGDSDSSWGGYFSGTYGAYAVNDAGSSVSLANGGYGVYTDYTIRTNSSLCIDAVCKSSWGVAGNNFGGMYTTTNTGACWVGNPWTAACSCPATTPTARLSNYQIDEYQSSGTFLNTYYCTG